MKSWMSYRYNRKELFLIVAMLFSTASILQMLSIPPPTSIYETYPYQTSKDSTAEDDPVATSLSNEENVEIPSENKLLFQSVPDVVIPNKHEVPIRGLKELPKRFLRTSSTTQEEFRYRLQPTRIMDSNGLLAIREFQGNTWTGTLMKGAVVFFVQSSLSHYRRRLLLRTTWAAVRDIESWKIEVIFVVGKPRNVALQERLVRENSKFGDILQYQGSDNFNASTTKVLAGLSWAVRKLPNDFYYASMPDDVLVNIGSVRDYISGLSNHYPPPGQIFTVIGRDGSTVTSSQPQTVYCFGSYSESDTTERNSDLARSVNLQVYTADVWPPYCGEGLYILPISFARELYVEWSLLNASLPYDLHDVLITGILRRKMNRGDANILTVANGDNMILQIEVLPRSSRTKLARFELDAEDKFRTAWRKWYNPVQNRFHILTQLTPS